MEIFTQKELELFTVLVKLSQNMLFKSMSIFLSETYGKKKVVTTKDYIYAKGNIPICLIAHLDTVHVRPPEEIYFDKEQDVLWSPQGIGADDRAGVFAIVNIIKDGYRPNIIFTTEEERGGIGAIALSKQKNPFSNLKYIIEIDRQDSKDCVFYDCDNPEFTEYIESFGFKEAFGTYTDIRNICPAWEIAGVNLSSGYYNEHSFSEYLKTGELKNTISKIKLMLDDAKNSKKFKYIPDTSNYFYDFGHYRKNSNIKTICANCGKNDYYSLMLPVWQSKHVRRYYCGDCLSNHVNWCSCCGDAYDTGEQQQYGDCNNLCPRCKDIAGI